MVICARTRLAAECGLDAAGVDQHLQTLTRRWNQFGLEALVEARAGPGAIMVHYRLSIPSHPDPGGVHAAFRDDMSRALASLSTVPAAPPSWDLEEMAAAAGSEQVIAQPLTYEDAEDDWLT